MEINVKNKELYEKAFITNGEYGVELNNAWTPSIDENEISEWCTTTNEKGEEVYIPATPLGYRDYLESRIEGIKNILEQPADNAFTLDSLYQIKKEDNKLKLYDKIIIDGTSQYVVAGEDIDRFFLINELNKKFYVLYNIENNIE